MRKLIKPRKSWQNNNMEEALEQLEQKEISENSEREYEAQLNQERAELGQLEQIETTETEETEGDQPEINSDQNSNVSPNMALGIILFMLAVIADLIGLIPIVGVLVSVPSLAIFHLGRRLSNYPTNPIAQCSPSNIIFITATFFGKSKSGQKLIGKIQKIPKFKKLS